ncbi:MAG: 23S rRNA (adenine(2503)-C(2))-methyltransferase RlmN [Alphaproteobacteria bacterium]|nr:23S rRNA (adenine(2503)-C(2))-methyltransferase RlmN [Alphaproteobacteria bacterium SS10]
MGADAHAEAFAAPAAGADGLRPLIGPSRDELRAEMKALGIQGFRADQIWKWVYQRGVTDFADMSNLAKDLRAKLPDMFTLARPEIIEDQESTDGTRKWLLRMADGQEVETVFIPEDDRGTLCVSSQVGCTLTCKFCHTGTQPLVRNLGPAEIVAQVLVARDALNDWPSGKEDRRLTNIVLMGMGEPLFNYDNVADAMRIVMDADGIGWSKRRITLSTSGVVPLIRRCGDELNVNLAISLHAVTDELRDNIMPINRKYPIKELMRACREYPGVSNSRRITFEYVMLKGVNDTPADARQLVRLLRGIPAKVNLIPFNPWPGAPYECSTPKAITAFGDIVVQAGYPAPVRATRGQDILAACGQLKSASQRQRAADKLRAIAANRAKAEPAD